MRVRTAGSSAFVKAEEETPVQIAYTPLQPPTAPLGERGDDIAVGERLRAKGKRWKKPPVWAYGVTTHKPFDKKTPYRRLDLLPKTLQSLAGAGFDKPVLFVDGDWNHQSWLDEFGLQTVCRYPAIRAFGNWLLAMGELMIRSPYADFYAIFQDDLICSKNLRQYIEGTEYPAKGYLNLYTFPKNQILSQGRTGFYPSNQKGLGALGLVFDRESALALMSDKYMILRPRNVQRGHKFIDGGVVDCMRAIGFREYVHSPSLVQHMGFKSTLQNPKHAQATSFRGEEFDALQLLRESDA